MDRSSMGLLAELKRRNVFRMCVAYLVLGWVVTEVTATMAPALHLPEWTLSLVVWIGVVGFPFVILFSWVYELTPEGLKRERDVDRTASVTHLTARRLDFLIIGMLAVAMGLFAFDRFGPGRAKSAATPSSAAQQTATPAAASPGKTIAAVDDKSIAVLPFVNMSSDPEQEYFSDGLSEELLNLLAKIPELRVIARTSSFAFKGKEVDIAAIAEKLQVAHVLEGSVRKSGNRVRITAQLIRAGNSSHLWSETWDRTLDDIFAIQDEIAAAVVAQLKLQLLGAANKTKETDPRAYAAYLQGRELNRQGTVGGFAKSIVLFQEALSIEPDYAAAWVGLSQSYLMQVNLGQRPVEEGFRLAREAANKALKIDSGFAPAHAVLGRIAMTYDGDLEASARHFEHALALTPDDTEVLRDAGVLAQNLGRLDQAIALQEYVVAHDPVSSRGHSNLGNFHLYAGHLNEAIASFRTALSLSPGILGPRYSIGLAHLLQGDPDAALSVMKEEPAEGGWGQIGLPMIYHAMGRKAESDAALEELVREFEKDSAFNIAYVHADRGEADRAFEWLDKAVAYRDGGLSEIAVHPFFANIRDDPRWLPFLRKLGKAPEQLAAIKFEAKPPS